MSWILCGRLRHRLRNTLKCLQVQLSLGDMSLVLPDADKVLVTMRLLPDQVKEYVQLHGSYGSFAEVRAAVDQYDQRLRAFETGLHVHAVQGTPRGSRAGSRDSKEMDEDAPLVAIEIEDVSRMIAGIEVANRLA